MSDVVRCECSKGDVLDLIQKDIRKLNTSYTALNAQMNNGVSTEVPLLRKAVDKMKTELTKLKIVAAPGNQASGWKKGTIRVVVTLGLGVIVTIGLGITILVGIRLGIIDLEDIGRMIDRATGG